MRVFLAIELPDYIKNEIANLYESLKPYSQYMRITPINNLHFTVKFLGAQNTFSLEKIKNMTKIETGKLRSFEISLSKSGIFGGLKNPKILWLGQDNKSFVAVSQRINEVLNIFRHEDKKPVCHLTIGRFKRIPIGNITEVLNICKDFVDKNNLRFCASSVYLYKSNLLRSGAIYEKIEKFNMKGNC